MRPLGTPHTVVLLVVLTALTPSILGCERRGRVDPGVSTGELPDQEVADFSVTETDQGNPQWTMYARSASVFSARNLIVAHGVRVDFFDQDGKRSSTLTAREGELHQLRRNMVARGNVVLQTAEGTRMSTEQLRFLNREQKIVSDDFVRVERGGDVLTGIGFESDPRLEHFEFKRQVRATVQTRSGGGIGTTPAPDTGGR